jgi:TQXA domain-containing protein/LPXTG-motif cell wall-anchored protein
MFGRRGTRWARAAVAVFAGAAMTLGVSEPASAESLPSAQGSAIGVPSRVDGASVRLMLNGKASKQTVIQLTVGAVTVPAFCIDFHAGILRYKPYVEGSWAESQVKNLGKVLWVLTRGYPNGDPTALVKAAGVQLPAGLAPARRDLLLYFGTQTAVWHFSDGVELGGYVAGKGLLEEPQYQVIKKIRDYLVAHATDQPEPERLLAITPPAATSAMVGKRVGPFTVSGPAGAITVRANGGTPVDADGAALAKTTNGGRFWLTRDSAGSVSVSAAGSGSVSFGRVFLYQGGRALSQKLVLGGSFGENLTAKATADFTGLAGAGAGLPVTGAPTGVAVAAGLALLVAGAVTVLAVRRRRVRFTV